ncbi:Tubby- protein 2 [Saguinus oedipus]|uniref:Tubby- protein 2 n=1 Tax=Saguinus oedipus TaxID=9490 RepID=A0ABQ9TWK5_SAGOE|nr:Tubby- protein 2 [Saguinus oedipus]
MERKEKRKKEKGQLALTLVLEEDLEKKREESESTGTNSSAAIDEELSKALKGEGGTGSNHMNREAYVAISSPCPRLGEDKKAYVLQPALQGIRMQCYIKRDNRGVHKRLFPLYYLYLENPDGLKVQSAGPAALGHFLLAGRKRRRSKTSNYLISLDPTDLSRDGDNFVGKVRSNALGTKFTIFDNGVNPDREHLIRDTARIRRELGAVCYETNALGFLGPREMTVVLPETDSENQIISVQPITEPELLLSRIQRGDNQGLLVLHNKTPLWNHEKRVFVLDFHGRVTMTSVKNFQIMHPKDRELLETNLALVGWAEQLVLQFGRVAPDKFTMDFCFPLSPLQAFAICLSSFSEPELLLSRIQRGDNQGLLVLHNKTPLWNHEKRVFVLDFHGRVTMTSVKNFQIMHPKDRELLETNLALARQTPRYRKASWEL